MDTTRTYPRELRDPTEARGWADGPVMRAFLERGPMPAKAATSVVADQRAARSLTVSPWRRILRALRLRAITKGPKL